ncbi:DUF461 domain-containing protein [Streptomyces sp. H39-S7]|uniref:DUF461 domain-containing protein n=1 Tax=Streptomyces sp. H39-S7 TaxID=3004357 RepID=UPI0022AF9D82|nr:DUF461 domain-containing protein [Streptomyces sp. H39-S7]MCZ4120832.1 DUF461 domain-containing protein [Streptomyces sp. H39-S7]
MSSSLRRGALAAALALSIAPLAACGAGTNAQTNEVRPDNAEITVGDIQVQNAVILTQKAGTGPSAVSARIYNNGNGNQTLQSVKVGDALTASLSGTAGSKTITVPAHGSVLLGGAGNPSATLPNSNEAIKDGDFQRLALTFSATGEVALSANVLPAAGYYQKYGATSSPSPAAAPSGKATPTSTGTPEDGGSATPTGGATPTGTGTPTGSGTPSPKKS